MVRKISKLAGLVALIAAIAIAVNLYVPLSFFDKFPQLRPKLFGATITTIQGSDTISGSRTTINTNFSNLNTTKLESGNTAAALTITALTTNGITQNTTASSTFSGGISTLGLSTTNGINIGSAGTSTFANGLTVTGGCIYFSGQCLGATTVSSVTANNSTLTISPTTGNVLAQINLSTANAWTTTASTSFAAGLYANLVGAPYFNATSTTATSTFNGGTLMTSASTTNLSVSQLCYGCILGGGNSYQIVNNSGSLNTANGGTTNVTATCPGSKMVTGGGFSGMPQNSGTASTYSIQNQYMNATSTYTMQVICSSSGTCISGTLVVYAVCVNP